MSVALPASTTPKNHRLLFLIPIVFFLIAVALRMWFHTPYLEGDEPATLYEARNIGRNFQGLPYYLVMNLWLRLGDSNLWIRIPSILMGSAAIPLIWFWLKPRRGVGVALITSGLLMIAPAAIDVSQNVRFYGLFMMSLALFFWAYFYYVDYPSRAALIKAALSAVLLIFSHLLGIFVVGAVILHWMLTHREQVPRFMWYLLGSAALALLVLVGIALFAPDAFNALYSFFSRAIAGEVAKGEAVEYSGPRGWSIVIIAKAVLTPYELTLGDNVYPFNLLVVIPSFLILASLGLLGLNRLRHTGMQYLTFILIVGFGLYLALLTIFEPLIPTGFLATLSKRHLSFVLPLLLWLFAEGVMAIKLPSVRYVAGTGLVLVFVAGLYYFANPSWNYTDHTRLISSIKSVTGSAERPIFLTNGGAYEYVTSNLPGSYPIESWVWDITPEMIEEIRDNYQELLMVVNATRQGNHCHLTQAIQSLNQYPLLGTAISYPFFFYAYDLTGESQDVITTPKSFYPDYFQDIPLPLDIQWQGQTYTIFGTYQLPTCQGENTWVDEIASDQRVSSLIMVSTVFNGLDLPQGTPIGTLTVKTDEGHEEVFDIRMGMETADWRADCEQPCAQAYSWFKYAQLRGFSNYPTARDQFTASLFGVEFQLDDARAIKRVTLQIDDPDLEFFLWGLYPN